MILPLVLPVGSKFWGRRDVRLSRTKLVHGLCNNWLRILLQLQERCAFPLRIRRSGRGLPTAQEDAGQAIVGLLQRRARRPLLAERLLELQVGGLPLLPCRLQFYLQV